MTDQLKSDIKAVEEAIKGIKENSNFRHTNPFYITK